MAARGRDRAILFGALAAVVVAGWAALMLWGASPWSRYLSHEELEHGGGSPTRSCSSPAGRS